MKNQHNFRKRISILFLYIVFTLLMTGCQKNTPEKIAEAQETFLKLVDIHNQVVEAHKYIEDSSLDTQLVSLAEKVTQIESFNLNEMTDEDIDILISSMNSIISSYQEYLTSIETIKAQEEAAVIIPVYVTLCNNTEFTFTKLELYEKNSSALKTNILEDFEGFVPGQYLAGLTIYKNADSTPWILTLENAEGLSYQIELPVESYESKEYTLYLSYDSESEEIKCLDKQEEQIVE